MATSVLAPPRRPEIKTELPGPNARKIIEADERFVNPAYPRPDFKLVAERASGVWVEDVDGNVFLDCNAGVAVCSTGHCHPEVVAGTEGSAVAFSGFRLEPTLQFHCICIFHRSGGTTIPRATTVAFSSCEARSILQEEAL